MKAKIMLLGLAAICGVSSIRAQYCTPTITSSGIYFNNVNFVGPGSSGITGGVAWTGTGSQGFVNNSAGSSGTVGRYCEINIYYNVMSCAAPGTIPYNVRVFADYNNDFDFDDAGETVYDYDYTAQNCTPSGAAATFAIASNAPSTIRLRCAVREGGLKANPCGGYVGEIEDYSLTVTTNAAPVISAPATAFVNALKETQTNSDGFSIAQLLNSSYPGTFMFSDGNACTASGVAITSVSGTGQWQFKNGSGAWTDVGAVAVANALLLAAQDTYTASCRLRFVPSEAGSATIDFKAWDRTSGTVGGYANTTTSGGTSAFSTGSKTASITVYSAASTASDVNAYMATASNYDNIWNVKSTSLNRSTGILKNPDAVTTDNVSGFAFDIDIDNTNNKLVWAGGNNGTKLMRSNLDGSSIQTLSSGALMYPTGIASSATKIFVADYGTAIYSYNLDGSGMTAITGGAGQANDISITSDIEYASNKIYYVNSPDAIDYNIVQANPDGTGSTTLYTTSTNLINGLSVTGNAIFWTEMDASNNAMVKTKPIVGGAVTTLVTEANQYYFDVFADEANSRIYMTVVDAGTFLNCRIKSIPLAGGATTRLLDLEDNMGAIAFRATLGTLPVHFINVKAYKVSTDVKVEWNIAMEENVLKYVVERSADGRQFVDVGSVFANNQSNYSWLDQQPLSGKNFYRIKAVDIDGSLTYSSIVVVDMGKDQTFVSVYPTISENRQFNLRLENADAGTYTITAINAAGQHVYTKNIIHTGGSSVQDLKLPSSTPAGVYRLRISGKEKIWMETVIVK